MIVSDDLNTNIGPFMGITNHTPHLDRLAAEGVRFSRAYSQFPLCGPSRASFMSGLYPQTNGVLENNDQPGSYRKETPALAVHPSVAGLFRKRGYYTARISKIFHMGVPVGIERGEPGGDDPDSWDYAYTITGGGAATIRTDRWRYTRWGENASGANEELYDHQTDPKEHVNLIGDPSKRMALEEFFSEIV
ncbi:sulfatase-like hydrolase/transferase [Cyclobacterium plantarum]|uniref:sulfatase-like hydrolase/transferase n=1 Tax=Cyclobacterium plantarum TaxID=2716263 RepID=UPI0021D2D079|nr:sulfatase-like hydrolase/transferase [Cyclobacterium plantarum]